MLNCSQKESGTFEGKIIATPEEFGKHIKRNNNSSITIPALILRDEVIADDAEKAEGFNLFFRSVFSPKCDRNMTSILHCQLWRNEMCFKVLDIKKLLDNLTVSKAMGPDEIPLSILRSCSNPVSSFLFVLFEKSLSEYDFPVDWKWARVIALHISGPKNNVENYRPLSLTSICFKTLEHILFTSIMHHYGMFNILTPFQHGIRRGYPCVTQWLNLHMICS